MWGLVSTPVIRKGSRGGVRWISTLTMGAVKRARTLALAALKEVRRRELGLYTVLATSGSAGWHLFVFPEVFQPIDHWTRLLKQVASCIGAEIMAGICEIFPQETRQTGALPYGIRAPGTWNPKTDEVGLIACSSVELILNSAHKKKEEEESPFLYRSTYPAEKFGGDDGSRLLPRRKEHKLARAIRNFTERNTAYAVEGTGAHNVSASWVPSSSPSC